VNFDATVFAKDVYPIKFNQTGERLPSLWLIVFCLKKVVWPNQNAFWFSYEIVRWTHLLVKENTTMSGAEASTRWLHFFCI